MESIIWLRIVSILVNALPCYCLPYVEVEACPTDLFKWLIRTEAQHCSGSFHYHCMLHMNSSRLFETCLPSRIISPGEIGCPQIMIYKDEPIHAADLSSCPEQNNECPPTDHRGYATDELYLYPACFLPEQDRVRFTTRNDKEVEFTEKKSNEIAIEVLAFGLVMLMPLAVGMCMILARKQRKYREKKVEQETLQFMMGEVWEETDGSTEDQCTASVTEISGFTHGTEYIRCIQCISESEAWIHSYKSTKNERVNNKGKQNSERMIGTDFDDFIVIDNYHVYTLFGDKMIRRVSASGVISDVTSTAPLRPTGICAARAGGLLVCLCSDNVPNINKDSYGEVHHLDMNGKLMRKYPDRGDSHKKLFTLPRGIVQNINLDICVVDTIATDHTSRLVVVSEAGDMKFKYKGHRYMKYRLSCQNVTCDTNGRIMLTDYHNHAVHLLTADGEFIKFLLTNRSTLRYPRSLAVTGDKLWVGCDVGFIKVYKIKL